MFALHPKSKASTWRSQVQPYKCSLRPLIAHDAPPALQWNETSLTQDWTQILKSPSTGLLCSLQNAEVWLSWINKGSTQWHFCYYVTPCLQFIHPQICSKITIDCILGTASTEAKGFGAQECKLLFAGQGHFPDIKQPPKGYPNNIHVIFGFNSQQFLFQVNQVLKAKHSLSDLHIWSKAVYNCANQFGVSCLFVFLNYTLPRSLLKQIKLGAHAWTC